VVYWDDFQGGDPVDVGTNQQSTDPDISPMWRLGGVSLREAIQLTSLSRGTILARVYSGEWPVSRFGRRLVLPKAFLLDTLSKAATGGVGIGE
jgi:hypothetical protein